MEETLVRLCVALGLEEESHEKCKQWVKEISKKVYVAVDDIRRLEETMPGAMHQAKKTVERLRYDWNKEMLYDRDPFIRHFQAQLIYYIQRVREESN